MNLDPVLGLLRTRTGLESVALGSQTVQAAVRSRMKALELSDGGAYLDRLQSDGVEFAALVDEVVVPETWFFRGGEVFDYLAGYIRAEVLARPNGPVFRVLSLPCSTGEEPYSLAIALREKGCDKGCAIDGIDISARNLDDARRGVFGDLSFRQMSPSLRSRYFRAGPEGWEIDVEVRQAVRFLPGNILDTSLPGTTSYDLILCRNLFIYLGSPARQRGLANLDRLLAPGGVLGLGYAEPLDRDDRRFEKMGPSEHFLYRKAPLSVKPLPAAVTAEPLPPAVKVFLPLPQPPPRVLLPRRTIEPPPESVRVIDRARLAADRGSYEEAYRLCAGLLAEAGPDADVYALMGVIQQARHLTVEARQHLERALYLDPNHRVALFHLFLLHQQSGNIERAAVLRRRLDRCDPEAK